MLDTRKKHQESNKLTLMRTPFSFYGCPNTSTFRARFQETRISVLRGFEEIFTFSLSFATRAFDFRDGHYGDLVDRSNDEDNLD